MSGVSPTTNTAPQLPLPQPPRSQSQSQATQTDMPPPPPPRNPSRPSLVPEPLRLSPRPTIVPAGSMLPPLEGRGPAPPLTPRRRESSMQDFSNDMHAITNTAQGVVQGFWHHTTPALPLAPPSPRLQREVRQHSPQPNSKGKTAVYKLEQQARDSSSALVENLRPQTAAGVQLQQLQQQHHQRRQRQFPHPHDAPQLPLPPQPQAMNIHSYPPANSWSIASNHPTMQPPPPIPYWAQPMQHTPVEYPGFTTMPNGWMCNVCHTIVQQPLLHTTDGVFCFNGQWDPFTGIGSCTMGGNAGTGVGSYGGVGMGSGGVPQGVDEEVARQQHLAGGIVGRDWQGPNEDQVRANMEGHLILWQ